jgi:hypothetical protein
VEGQVQAKVMLRNDEVEPAAFDSDHPELLGFWTHPLRFAFSPETARYALPSISDSNKKYSTWWDW